MSGMGNFSCTSWVKKLALVIKSYWFITFFFYILLQNEDRSETHGFLILVRYEPRVAVALGVNVEDNNGYIVFELNRQPKISREIG